MVCIHIANVYPFFLPIKHTCSKSIANQAACINSLIQNNTSTTTEFALKVTNINFKDFV